MRFAFQKDSIHFGGCAWFLSFFWAIFNFYGIEYY